MSKVVFGSLLALTFVLGTSQAHAQGTWETSEGATPTLASMPTGRNTLAAGAIHGKLYVVGGSGGLSVLEKYDPATDTWSTKAPLPTNRAFLAAAVTIDKLYVVSGCINADCNNDTGVLEVYDPATDTWDTTKAPISPPRPGLAFVEIGGKLYAVGGTSFGPVFKSTLEVYDPGSDTWSTKAPMPTARTGAAGAINGKLYVVGGQGSTGVLNTLEVYDPATDIWTTLAPMPTPRSGMAAGVINGKLYVVGGFDGAGSVDTVEVFDPNVGGPLGTWSTETDMPTARSRLAAAVIDGKLYAVGGDGGLDALEVFTPAVDPAQAIQNAIDALQSIVDNPATDPDLAEELEDVIEDLKDVLEDLEEVLEEFF